MKFEYVVPNMKTQHGTLTPFCAVVEFSAVTITVSEPFLQPTAEIGAESVE